MTFSIIIPVYNVAPYLRECLDSVLAQTFTDWEAICVDDGSTDGSGAILDEYAAKDPRFKAIHQPNAGVSAARNRGLDEVKGDWVGFLDADDVWMPWMLSNVSWGMGGDSQVDWIRTSWINWEEGAKFPADVEESRECTCFDSSDMLVEGWWAIARCSFPVINFYRRGLVSGERFPVGVRFREDAIFCYAMVSRANRICVMEAKGYVRRIRKGGATFSVRRRDDTINLLSSFETLCDRIISRGKNDIRSDEIRRASTYWVAKDIRQWIFGCPDRTLGDAWRVWRQARKLLGKRFISFGLPGTRLSKCRWTAYLLTGIGRVLRIERGNPFGRAPKGRVLA